MQNAIGSLQRPCLPMLIIGTCLATFLAGFMYMGQILQDGKKVLEMSVTYLNCKSRPAQTVGPGTFSF